MEDINWTSRGIGSLPGIFYGWISGRSVNKKLLTKVADQSSLLPPQDRFYLIVALSEQIGEKILWGGWMVFGFLFSIVGMTSAWERWTLELCHLRF